MKKTKTIIWWVVILAVVIGGGYYYFKPKDTGPEYTTEKPQKTDLSQTVSVTGEVVDVSKADLSAEVTGTIEEIFVDVGDKVEEGDEVARIDDSVLQSQLQEALVQVNIQQEQLDLKRRKWDLLKPEEKEAAKLAVESARAAAWTIQKQIKKTIVYAPVAGTVSKRYVEPGETVTISSPIIRISGDAGVEIEADVPESDIDKVKIGQVGKATFDAFSSDEFFDFEVTEIEPSATVIQDVVYYKVTFKILSDVNSRIKSGMSTDIDILTAEKKDVLAVSNQAVKNDDGNRYVEILEEKDGIKNVNKVNVKIGIRGDEGMTEIISGLNGDENVITYVKESE